MTESTNTQTRARTLFEDLVARVEQFAQAPDATEEIVLQQSRPADERAGMRLEYELPTRSGVLGGNSSRDRRPARGEARDPRGPPHRTGE